MEFPLRRVLHVHLAIRTLGEKRTGFSLGQAETGRQDWDGQDEDGLPGSWTVDLDGAETLMWSEESRCKLLSFAL